MSLCFPSGSLLIHSFSLQVPAGGRRCCTSKQSLRRALLVNTGLAVFSALFLPPIHLMLLGLCLSTAVTLDAPCGTEPLLLLPQRLTPGTVPESELGYNECFCCGCVWDSGAREQNPPPPLPPHPHTPCLIA